MDTFSNYFLSKPEIWFNKNYNDKFISEKFGSILFKKNIFENITLQSDSKELLDFIITFDQLPYYVFRDNKIMIEKFHNMSLYVADKVIDSELFNNYSCIEKCFIMLPLRHSNDIGKNKKILSIITKLYNENNNSYYKRFYKATLEKVCLLNNKLDIYYYDNDINTDILDKECTFKELQKIKIEEKLFDCKHKRVCVSLSGGVDSIVLLYYLHSIGVKLLAVNINYNNRSTSEDETRLCIKICNYLNIPIYVRTINEIKRDRQNDRDIYEDITKKIRLDLYKKICEKENCVIALGHNKDDCIENIFSNIIKQQKMDNLKGMSENMDYIYRPMLNIYKSKIYEIAHKYELPYVYDSTPEWSERGQKRDKLLPFLKDFDPRIIEGLLTVSERLSCYSDIVDKYIIDSVIFTKDKVVIKKNKYDFNILKDILSYICKSKSIPYFTNKSIINLHTQIINEQYNKKITLSENYYFYNFTIFEVAIRF